MKHIQLIIIIILVMAFTFIGIGVFRDKTEVLTNEIIHVNESLTEIRRDKSEILIDNFTGEFQEFRWISSDRFVFYGNNKIYGEGEYLVDLSDLSLNRNTYSQSYEELQVQIDNTVIENYEALSDMDGLSTLIFIKDEEYRGIYLYDFENKLYTKITEAMKCNLEDMPYFKISSDLSKLVYVEDGKNRLVTYNFENEKKRIIMREYSDELIDNFDNVINISYDGGYICVINDSQNINEMNFSVIGADSGSFYSDYINGISPNFNTENNGLYYIYAGEIENKEIDSGLRIGYIDFETKKIEYKKENGNNIYNKIYSVDDKILYFIGKKDGDEFLVSNLVSYNFSDKKRVEFEMENKLIIGEDVAITRMNSDLIINSKDTARIIRLVDGLSRTYVGLEPIRVNGNEASNIYIKDNYIIFKDSRDLYKISDSKSIVFYSTSNQIQGLEIPDSEDKIIIFEEDNGNSEIVVTYKY